MSRAESPSGLCRTVSTMPMIPMMATGADADDDPGDGNDDNDCDDDDASKKLAMAKTRALINSDAGGEGDNEWR